MSGFEHECLCTLDLYVWRLTLQGKAFQSRGFCILFVTLLASFYSMLTEEGHQFFVLQTERDDWRDVEVWCLRDVYVCFKAIFVISKNQN